MNRTMDKPKRNQTLESTALPDGHLVLVNQTTSWAHTLSPLASLIWEFCDGKHTVDEIELELKSIPEIGNRDSLKKEISDLLLKFEQDGFLEE